MVENSEQLSLDTIIDDCKEKIFDWIDLEHLLQIGDVSKELRIQSNVYYFRKFSKKDVFICSNKFSDSIENIQFQKTLIRVDGMKISMSYLRQFGSMISNLILCLVSDKRRINRKLANYVNQYCAMNLRSLCLFFLGYTTPHIFQNVFPNLINLKMEFVDFGEELPALDIRCPKLRNLTLIFPRLNGINSRIYLPNLKTLFINSNPRDFSIFYVNSIILRCPNIMNLTLDVGEAFSFRVVRDLLEDHSKLTKLYIWDKFRMIYVPKRMLLKFANDHQALERLKIPFCPIRPVDAVFFMSKLPNLELFCFRLSGSSKEDELDELLNSEWTKVYCKHKTILLRRR